MQGKSELRALHFIYGNFWIAFGLLASTVYGRWSQTQVFYTGALGFVVISEAVMGEFSFLGFPSSNWDVMNTILL